MSASDSQVRVGDICFSFISLSKNKNTLGYIATTVVKSLISQGDDNTSYCNYNNNNLYNNDLVSLGLLVCLFL